MSEPGQPAAELCVVLTTLPTPEAAEALIRALVEERLAACGNIVPGLTSIYRWEAETVAAAEALVLLKTPRQVVPRLFDRIRQLHPYEVPELVALPVDAVSHAYGRWVRQETTEVSA